MKTIQNLKRKRKKKQKMICENCIKAGDTNTRASVSPYLQEANALLATAIKLHEQCLDNSCMCQHRTGAEHLYKSMGIKG
jgi:hypothetical protein